jgi:hypothetical protein
LRCLLTTNLNDSCCSNLTGDGVSAILLGTDFEVDNEGSSNGVWGKTRYEPYCLICEIASFI